jgi:23S rRNA pseudouridine2605 synthase
MMIRLNKFIAESGISSRRKSEILIEQGRVMVNDKLVKDLSFKIDPENDIVEVDGEKIYPKKYLYFVLNKPKGFITSTSDDKKRKTVIDLIKTNEKIFPIGRLDYNTTGVLLLTNDGEFANLLMHPKNKVPKVYEVWLDRELFEEDKNQLLKGVFLQNKNGKFIDVFNPSKKNKKFVTVVAEEGRNHFVKNMFQKLGYYVVNLNRKSYAGIQSNVPLGRYRTLTKNEVNEIIKIYAK